MGSNAVCPVRTPFEDVLGYVLEDTCPLRVHSTQNVRIHLRGLNRKEIWRDIKGVGALIEIWGDSVLKLTLSPYGSNASVHGQYPWLLGLVCFGVAALLFPTPERVREIASLFGPTHNPVAHLPKLESATILVRVAWNTVTGTPSQTFKRTEGVMPILGLAPLLLGIFSGLLEPPFSPTYKFPE